MDGEGADGPPPRGAAAPYDWTRVYKEAEAELVSTNQNAAGPRLAGPSSA